MLAEAGKLATMGLGWVGVALVGFICTACFLFKNLSQVSVSLSCHVLPWLVSFLLILCCHSLVFLMSDCNVQHASSASLYCVVTALSFQPFPDAWAFPVLTLLIVVIKWLLSVDHQPGQQVKRRGGTLEASSGTPRTSRHILALTPCSCRHAST